LNPSTQMNGEEFPKHFHSIKIDSKKFKYSHETKELFIISKEGKILKFDFLNFQLQEIYPNSNYQFNNVLIHQNYLFCYGESETVILKDENFFFTRTFQSVEVFDEVILGVEDKESFKMNISELINKNVKMETMPLMGFTIQKIGKKKFVMAALFDTEIFSIENSMLKKIKYFDGYSQFTADESRGMIYYGENDFIEVVEVQTWNSIIKKVLNWNIEWLFVHENFLIVGSLNKIRFLDKETLQEFHFISVKDPVDEKIIEEEFLIFNQLKSIEIWKFPKNTTKMMKFLNKEKLINLNFKFH
jgi:hypothetical protein